MAETSDRRRLERVLNDLGYRPERVGRSAATIWKHPSGLIFSVHRSPSDVRWLANCLAELHRRHPNHVVFARRKASREQRFQRRARQRRHQRALQAVTPVVAVKPPPVVVPNQTSCVDCGRRWASEIDPTGRPCPACGGEVMVGRDEIREFRWRLAT